MFVQQTGENRFALTPVAQLFADILDERDRRIEAGEDRDPLCVLADRIESGVDVDPALAEFVWAVHHGGPWMVDSPDKFTIFTELCAESGFPIEIREPSEVVCRIPIYRDDLGDCVMRESARGQSYAVWTRKGRVYIGFEFPRMAEIFRSIRPEYSLETTGNRHIGMVVLENADNADTIFQVCCDIIVAKSDYQQE